MEPTAQPPNPNPMRQSHLPITEAEMNPNMHNENQSSGKYTLVTLASLLVLAGVVGITLYLYIQNKNGKISFEKSGESPKEGQITDSQLAVIPTMTKSEEEKIYGNVTCRRFTSISEALSVPDIACNLDLSNQELSSLPDSISRLTNLTEINLSNNKFTEFPSVLLGMNQLFTINLENNKITTIPNEITTKLTRLQSLYLKGNSVSSMDVAKYQTITAPHLPTKK